MVEIIRVVRQQEATASLLMLVRLKVVELQLVDFTPEEVEEHILAKVAVMEGERPVLLTQRLGDTGLLATAVMAVEVMDVLILRIKQYLQLVKVEPRGGLDQIPVLFINHMVPLGEEV